MSNYTKNTNFTAKDNLTSGDPAKVIKGSEFDTEFNAIETAVNSKANKNNSVLTGTTNISQADIDTLQIDSVTVTATSAELNTLDGYTGDVTDLNKLADVTATATELNLLDGVTSTTAELNILDGVTATANEINVTDGLTASTSELNVLDGATLSTDELNLLDGVTATTTELNILDGVTSTTAEINKLDGFTGTVDDLNYAKDLRATGVTTTELDVLDGITATTTELNILDGVTATTAELNILDGVTATASELNITDGLTATTTELNYTDGVTSNIQTQLNGKATSAQGTLADSAVQPDDNVSFGTGDFSGDVDVTGTVTADGLTVDTGGANQVASFSSTDAGAFVYIQDSNALGYYHGSSSGTYVVRDTDNKNRINISSGGDVSFYEDTGTTAKMVWDASAESLSIGTNVSSGDLQIKNLGFIGFSNAADNGNDKYIYANGDNFEFGTAAQTRLTINSSGNVGIGTSTGTGTGINLSSGTNGTVGDGSGVFLSRGGNNPNLRGAFVKAVNTSGGSNAHALTFGTSADSSEPAERVRIDSAGNVGIGTDSPQTELHVKKIGTANARLTVERSTGNKGTLTAGASTGFTIDSNDSNGGTNAIRFSQNGSERARIDSSGNLLVGTTNSVAGVGNTDAGVSMRGTQGSFFSRDSGVAIHAGRSGNDGEIIQLRKDGNPVGSIQSRAGLVTTLILDPRSTGAGITGGGVYIYPTNNTGSLTDGVLSLGIGANRFKDLYLSGGVYLGGTGAANKLDDYEEGSWLPVVTGNTTAGTCTYSGFRNGYYTKIGNNVSFNMIVGWSGHTGTGAIRISLPFLASSATHSFGAFSVSTVAGYSYNAGYYLTAGYSPNKSNIEIAQSPTGGGTPLGADIETSVSYFIVSGTYRTA